MIRALLILAAILGIAWATDGFADGTPVPPTIPGITNQSAQSEIPPGLIQQIANDPAIQHPAWTQPSAIYTVTAPNHPGAPCVLDPSCTYQSAQPSQITVFTHADDPSEGPTYGYDYCHEQMVEAAPGTTCTVRPDPLDLQGD